jgi:hypothetical protein
MAAENFMKATQSQWYGFPGSRDELSTDGMSRVLDLCEDCVSEVKTTLDLD